MNLALLLALLPSDTPIRIRIAGGEHDYVWKTGIRKSRELMQTLCADGFTSPKVAMIYPLFRAHELYIMCE